MFEKFFGLKENPFNLTPDPRYLFLSETHKEALSHLRYGIEQRKGFVMITGEAGTGKTTTCRALLASLKKGTRTALILNPSLSDVELLQSINQEFGIRYNMKSKKELLDELNIFLLKTRENDENAVLIIDECQNLSPDLLEQIRMLSNLETETEKLLQILIIGQPEFAKMLESQSLKQLNDRIVLRYNLGPLSLSEMKDYIRHRLLISGAHGEILFSWPALSLIYKYSKGLPRRINALCERSLLITSLSYSHKVNRETVRTAIRELKGVCRHYYRRKLAYSMAVLIAIVVISLLFLNPSIITALSGVFDNQDKNITYNKPVNIANFLQNKKEPELKKSLSVFWVCNDLTKAKSFLNKYTNKANEPDILNLHPAPASLSLIGKPFIAVTNNGYAVVKSYNERDVEIVDNKLAVINIPTNDFDSVYKWNVMIDYTKTPLEKIYQMGDTNENIKWVQTVLNYAGYINQVPDGTFSLTTVNAIKKVQETFGTKIDGIIGPETYEIIKILGRIQKA